MRQAGGLFMVSLVFFAVGCMSMDATGSRLEEAWDQANDPLQLGQGWERGLERLPQQGQISRTPWSDTYWPSYLGGIAYRWSSSGELPSNYRPQSFADAAQLGAARLAMLSPAEKFDLLNGRFDYPTVQRELGRTRSTDEQWVGLCHGWAAASLNFNEPQPVIIPLPSKVDLTFHSADVKALLSYYQAEIGPPPSRSLGQRCNVNLRTYPTHAETAPCRDVNAGSFHIILTNMIGLRGQGFIADLTRGNEVWNHPVYGFATRAVTTTGPSQGAAAGTVREVTMQTRMHYTTENGPNQHPFLGTRDQQVQVKDYTYRLELDANGQIIGGAWNNDDRPDFLWTQGRPELNNVQGWEGLSVLYKNATR